MACADSFAFARRSFFFSTFLTGCVNPPTDQRTQNAVEHITAVICSFKGRLELALAVAVGSSIQVALLLLPFLVLLGWMISQPLTLYFDLYETIILFICKPVALVLIRRVSG